MKNMAYSMRSDLARHTEPSHPRNSQHRSNGDINNDTMSMTTQANGIRKEKKHVLYGEMYTVPFFLLPFPLFFAHLSAFVSFFIRMKIKLSRLINTTLGARAELFVTSFCGYHRSVLGSSCVGDF